MQTRIFEKWQLIDVQGNMLYGAGAVNAAMYKYEQAFRSIEYEETDNPMVCMYVCMYVCVYVWASFPQHRVRGDR